MKCEYCEMIESRDVIFQDKDVAVGVLDKVITPGQLVVFPKEHFTILELVPKNILTRCSAVANKVSVAVFEGLGSAGTNIIVRNGLGADQTKPHFGIEVIPRQENDNVKLQWEPIQLMEDEMDMAFETISALSKDLSLDNLVESIQDSPESEDEEKSPLKNSDSSKNYLLKSLRRIP
jgi:histidine triad (HIT) family protein